MSYDGIAIRDAMERLNRLSDGWYLPQVQRQYVWGAHARVERGFESKIQFVELELTGCRLFSKSISIPNELLVGEDKDMKERLKNSAHGCQPNSAGRCCAIRGRRLAGFISLSSRSVPGTMGDSRDTQRRL
ncbi:MAG: hypothetical protein Q8N23_14095 [Archangium sp.]|nr:hypothetical protein [Archangium sp.]MDP3438268.1 hypothetical protein [Azonexus sp.]MDP3639551.1 hypothetical protein [Azonexus sp.]MDZ4314359.1 hypothetical protein [Azonexus sp.]